MSKKLTVMLLTFVLIFTFTGFAMAISVTHNETGLRFNIPDSWSHSEEDDIFTVVSPDEDVILFIFAGSTNNVEDFLDNIADELDNIFEDAEITEDPYEKEVNGLTQIRIEGTGSYDGEDVDWEMTMVFGATKAMSVIALGNISELKAAIDGIYSSITGSRSGSTGSGSLTDVLTANKWNMLVAGQSYGTLVLKKDGTAVKTGEGGIMETKGTWALEKDQFTLHFPGEGDPFTGPLSQKGKKITINFFGIVWTLEPMK